MNIFVTGTDTNIGKTIVSTILAIKFNYRYWKPIQCGLDELSDSDWVKQFIGAEKIQREVYRLKNPLSPHLAARKENQVISMQELIKNYPKDRTIIEGAGGLLVPLNSKEFLIDLIPIDKCKVVLVARSSLGTINHTLLSIEALRKWNLNLWGVVMVGEENEENKKAIEEYGQTTVLAEIPFVQELSKKELVKIANGLNWEKNIWN